MNTANWLQDFVRWVITLQNTNELMHEDRNRLIVAIEQCVCHKPLLKRYLAVLQVAMNSSSRPRPLLTPEQAGRLAGERVAVLDNRDLVSLALDPVSMWTLHDAVCEEMPEWWTDRVIEADEQFLRLGPVTETTSQPGIAQFPWDKLDLVSRESVSALLEVGDMAPLSSPTNDTCLPRARAAAGMKRLPSTTRSLPAVRLAASQKQLIPDETCSPTLAVIRKHGAPFTFSWRGAQYTLSADADASVYVDAPSTVTHLKVGATNVYPLQGTEIEGRLLVTGVKRPQLRRRIEAGETVTFWSQDTEDE